MVKKKNKLELKDLIIKSFVTGLQPSDIQGGRPPNTGHEGICTEAC